MRVTVAGGTGFIGRHVVDALLEAGHEVVVLARRDRDLPPGARLRLFDVGAGVPGPDDGLRGADAVVNLVGIKREEGDNTFARAHVDAVRHLAEGMAAAGVRRLVHVSVVKLPEALSTYAASKAAGEALAREAELDTTVLRPALVVGPGDDATTNLIRFVRLAPIFPVAAGPLGPLTPVDVRDVAQAVVRALARPQTAGRTYDIAGPHRVDLRGLVRQVATALRLPTLVVPVPAFTQRIAAAVMERVLADPPVTSSQLAMLSHGLAGDPEPAQRDLGLQSRALDGPRIESLAAHVVDVMPSVRLVSTPEHRDWLRAHARGLWGLGWLLPLAMAAMLITPRWLPNVWVRMASLETGLAVLAVAALGVRWRSVVGASGRAVLTGLGAAAALYVVGGLGFAGLRGLTPSLAAQAQVMLAWPDTMPIAAQLPLLIATVVGEDIVWRAGVALPVAARYGAWWGVAASGTAFALAHVTSGPPLLWLSALIFGAAWAALLLRTRSLVAVSVCHLTWDALVVYILPY